MRERTHLAPYSAIASIAHCSAKLASSSLRCRCRSLRRRSLSCFVPPPPAGLGEGFVCCVPLAASAEGSVACTASCAVLRTLALPEGSVLGQLLPCDELASPLLPAAAAALLDGPPPTPPLPLPAVALPLSFFCLPCGAPRETHHAVSGENNGNAASL